ncbi:retron St85 family RNA-directed DNA polymerase [Marinococcus halotolerans]|uniref:retron St85 family RNA-directed DNA polymerase n=1 Tax=Marinococcus halotolerans TaxID=301092 RepID=UPI0003B7735F|nr:retron St85 family RNA-directed DNA polymerase [Marinococcus halotolerans]
MLSNYIGVSKKILYLMIKQQDQFYSSFQLLKKNGSYRNISKPKFSLKLTQRWILEEILYKIETSNEALAFKKNVNGPKDNAEHHKYSLYLLQIDLENFFPSITKKQVFYIFKNIGYDNKVSNTLSNLCTYKDVLPQGAVTSPYLSNLICYKLDRRLKGLCGKRGILYTRYADDLTFSCNNKNDLKKIFKVVQKIINSEGYQINSDKTRFLSPVSHKKITGITVDSKNKLKADKSLKKKVRAMIHKAIVSGDYSQSNKIKGYISYIDSIENGYYKKIIEYIHKLINKEYKSFHQVVDCYNSNRNKLLKDLEKMEYEDFIEEPPENLDESDIEDYIGEQFKDYVDILKERKKFLNKHNFSVKEIKHELSLLTIGEKPLPKNTGKPEDLF